MATPPPGMLARIEAARSIPELEALVYELSQLPEADKALLRIPWRAARELLLRIGQAPAIASCDSSFSTFRRAV